MKIEQIRDITVVWINDDTIMGVSVDSCGGIGEKPHDTIKAPTKLVGSQTAKVMLAEIMCMGFKPKIISDGIANEMNDTGKEIIAGIEETISKLKNNDIHITGSTEENAVTSQTAIGTTCIGFTCPSQLRYKTSRSKDALLILGMPAVGPEVVNNPDKILQIEDFETLTSMDYIHQIIPIGSKGASYEIQVLCQENDMVFQAKNDIKIDLNKSGGPSCAAVISIKEDDIARLSKIIDKPLEFIGFIRRKND